MSCEDSWSVGSIGGSPVEVVLTPITSGLLRLEVQEVMEEFMLQGEGEEMEVRRSRGGRMQVRRCSTLEMFRLESDLDRIVEYDLEESWEDDQDSSPQHWAPLEEEDNAALHSNSASFWVKTLTHENTSKDIDTENTLTQALPIDYSENIQNFTNDPLSRILEQIRTAENLVPAEAAQQLRKYLEGFLLDYETPCFEEAWRELQNLPMNGLPLLKKGITETFSKTVGGLPFENRRVKLLKYLEKKKRRIWKKKVSYDCRKKVADGRLRIKGKFVTRQQACQQLGVETLEGYSPEDIKDMLERKMEEAIRPVLLS